MKSGIPSWQKASSSAQGGDGMVSPNSNASTSSREQGSISSVGSVTSDQEAFSDDVLLQQALKFLKDPSVQDASQEKKVAFLVSKGLSAEDIAKALNHTATTTTRDLSLPSEDRVVTAPAKQVDPISQDAASICLTSQSVTKQDVPPIIVYPEFLLKPQRPPPLITVQRLLNTAYVACGAAAVVYGTSKYLIGPMIENLTSARHEFAEYSYSQVDELNRKLGGIVSIDSFDRLEKDKDDAASIAESVEPDPSELYHRDFGTQTSSHRPISDTSSSTDDDDTNLAAESDITDRQASQLLKIKTRLGELRSEYDHDEQSTCAEIFTVVGVLNEHLESLAYPSDSYIGIYGGGDGGKKDDDEIARVKAEIRGVKGVLLSARNFKAPARGSLVSPVGS